MKNIQVIDGALNSTYSIYAASDDDFALIFPNESDIAFAEDFEDCSAKVEAAFTRLFGRLVRKTGVQGIHGTLFYGLEHKREYYPTFRDEEMVAPDFVRAAQHLSGPRLSIGTDVR